MFSVARPPAPINPILNFSLRETRRARCELNCAQPASIRPAEAVTELFRNARRLLKDFRLFMLKSIKATAANGQQRRRFGVPASAGQPLETFHERERIVSPAG